MEISLHHDPAFQNSESSPVCRALPGRVEIGYNHQIPYQGRVYHVQTEDSGRGKGHIDTHVFLAGAIVASNRIVYDRVTEDAKILDLLKGSHKSMLRKLVRGMLDRAIARHVGDDVRKSKSVEGRSPLPLAPPPAEEGSGGGRGALPQAVPATTKDTYLESINMDNVKKVLEQLLSSVNGALASALVDYESGMCLGTAGTGLDIDVAAAGNMEVMKAKARVMRDLGISGGIEDILITLESQYHIIRPVNDSIFLYLAFDRVKGNLAMARRKLASAAGDVEI